MTLKERENNTSPVQHVGEWMNIPTSMSPTITPSILSQETVNGVTTYTMEWDWNTLYEFAPPVHNGEHNLRLEWKASDGSVLIPNISDTSVEVKNLVVSASPEYLVYDPDAASPNNTITYNLEDAVPDENTSVTISIYRSDQTLVRADTFTTSTGTGKTYVWDGKDYDGRLMQKGIYLYKINASQSAQMDSDCDKSPWRIVSTSAQTIGIVQETGDGIMQIGYHIVPEENCSALFAHAAKVEVFNPNLVEALEQEAILPILVNQDAVFPTFNLTLDTPGIWCFLVSAWDKHPAHDRNHVNRLQGVRPLLQHNISKERIEIMVFLDAGHGTDPENGLTAPGTTGSKHIHDGQSAHDRYSWSEHDVVSWTRDELKQELLTHGLGNGCAYTSLDHLWRGYNVQYVPRYMIRGKSGIQSDPTRRANWVNETLKKQKPDYAVFISLHCDGRSFSTEPPYDPRQTECYYNVDITDSSNLSSALIISLSDININFDPPLNRAYRSKDGTSLTNMGLLRAMATRGKGRFTRQVPSNLLEMVMLTNPYDEDMINNGENRVETFGRQLIVRYIHSTYCGFNFRKVDYNVD